MQSNHIIDCNQADKSKNIIDILFVAISTTSSGLIAIVGLVVHDYYSFINDEMARVKSISSDDRMEEGKNPNTYGPSRESLQNPQSMNSVVLNPEPFITPRPPPRKKKKPMQMRLMVIKKVVLHHQWIMQH